jgi:hypothetical protein
MRPARRCGSAEPHTQSSKLRSLVDHSSVYFSMQSTRRKKHWVRYPVLVMPDPRLSRKASKGAAPARQRVPARALELPELDRLIHERLRLGIVSALATHASLSFDDLKRILRTTDGNLSVHARKLEKAEHIFLPEIFRRPRPPLRIPANFYRTPRPRPLSQSNGRMDSPRPQPVRVARAPLPAAFDIALVFASDLPGNACNSVGATIPA